MADNTSRSGKRAKREQAAQVDPQQRRRTEVLNPMHMGYNDKSIRVSHLTRWARHALGFPTDMSPLD